MKKYAVNVIIHLIEKYHQWTTAGIAQKMEGSIKRDKSKSRLEQGNTRP